MLDGIRRILDLLERRERWHLAALLGLTVVMALVQTVGVASIMPFMSLVGNPELVHEDPRAAWLFDHLGFESTRSFLIFVGVVVLAAMAFSNVFSAFTTWRLVRFAWWQQCRLSVRLLARYLAEPYEFFLTRNSAHLSRSVLEEVREVVRGVLKPGLLVIAHGTMVVFILLLLLAVHAAMAAALIVLLGGAYAILFTVVRRRQATLGKLRLAAAGSWFRAASEALGGIKEIQVLGAEAHFLEEFAHPARRIARANASNTLVREVPRFGLETLAFGSILVIVLYLLHTQDDFGQTLAVLSLFALAGYRLMPALQKIFQGFAQIRFFAPSLDHLHAELTAVREPRFRGLPRSAGGSAESVAFRRRVALSGVWFRYSDRDEWVLRDLDLAIDRNTTVGFVGATGSGKTTVVDIILGLLAPQRGRLLVDDVEIRGRNVRAWQRNLGYVPQEIFLCDSTFARNIAFGVPERQIDRAAVERAARLAHLHDFIADLPAGYDTGIGERGVRLSGGQRQRIGVARALYRDPDLLVLDEATSALDGVTESAVMHAVRDLAHTKTIIIVAHRLTTLRDCDVIFFVDGGRVAASGTYAELMETNVGFRAMARVGSSAPGAP